MVARLSRRAPARDLVRDPDDLRHFLDPMHPHDVRAEEDAGGHGAGRAPFPLVWRRRSPRAGFRKDFREGPERIGRSRLERRSSVASAA